MLCFTSKFYPFSSNLSSILGVFLHRNIPELPEHGPAPGDRNLDRNKQSPAADRNTPAEHGADLEIDTGS